MILRRKLKVQKVKIILSNTAVKATEAGLFFLMFTRPVGAIEFKLKSGISKAKPDDVPDDLFEGDGSIFKKVANILIFLVGAVSVIMLIIGGFRYVVSGGDSQKVESAKNTILYAIVGIVVSILAFAAVNFVVGQLL
jgi:hypothetical protein